MWLQRVLFNVRHRLLSLRSDLSTEPRHCNPPLPKTEDRRAQVIHNRIVDLDRRCAQLHAK